MTAWFGLAPVFGRGLRLHVGLDHMKNVARQGIYGGSGQRADEEREQERKA